MDETPLTQADILYRGSGLVAVNKPAGMPVHSSRILEDRPRTLLQMTRVHQGALMHAVHRLDRPVSGVNLFASDRDVLAQMSRKFEERRVKKCYLAVVRGWLAEDGVIDHPIRPPRDVRKPGAVARSAVTRFERIARIETAFPVTPYATSRYSLLALYPETGRRHQLRMHMKHISHHLVGDTTYGRGEHNQLFRERFNCSRLLLHAWSLEFAHPVSGQRVRIEAPLDACFRTVIERFSWQDAIAHR
ncbi:pseudouridine synthase [Pseudomonadota bacterium]